MVGGRTTISREVANLIWLMDEQVIDLIPGDSQGQCETRERERVRDAGEW